MKNMIHLFIAVVIVTIACNKKALPVITQRTTKPPAPVKKAIEVKPDIETGKVIFTSRCGRCHDLPNGILSYMIPRARLTDEQGVHVTAYLKTNAAKQ